MKIEPEDLEVLRACHEAQIHQQEMLPLLADTLGVPPEEVFYAWGFRRCSQSGRLADADWHYFFHGIECDVQNSRNGRFVRLDFGPGGRVDTVTAWGVLQFLMTSIHPWPEFAELKARFANGPSPWDQTSGDLHHFAEAWERLEKAGCFEAADPSLVELVSRSTCIGEDGIARIYYPPDTSEKVRLDSGVAHRQPLTANALRLLDTAHAVLGRKADET